MQKILATQIKLVIPKITVYGSPFLDNAHVTLSNYRTKLVQTLWDIHPHVFTFLLSIQI